ncbi:MAG: PAS domain S-box protein [Acidobacteriota bacterium]
MSSSRPLTGSLLLFSIGMLITAVAMQRQHVQTDAAVQAQFAQVASDNANHIIERIYRFQYGLKGIQGAIVGTDARHLSAETFHAFHDTQDVTLEFNGAQGFGYMSESAIPFFEPLDEVEPPQARALLHSPTSLAAAALAWSRQSPTLSAPLTLPQRAPHSDRSLLLLVPARPRDAQTKGWVYVLLDVDAALVDLSPRAQDYQLTITDITPGGDGERVFDSPPPPQPSPKVHWQSKRDVMGRRWLMEARADVGFGERLNLTSPSTVGWVGLTLTALLTALTYAFWVNRRRRSALHRQEAQLAAIVRNSSDAIVSQTPDGRILSWNRAAEQIFGIPAASIIGHPWSSLLLSHWDETEDRQLIDAVMAGRTPPPCDTVLRAADGTPIDVSISVAALTTQEGEVERISRTIRDNRERKAAEARLREFAQNLEQQVQARTAELAAATRHLQSVLDGMPSMIGYWDHELINRFANRAYAAWLKAPQGFVVGLHMEAVLGTAAFEAVKSHVRAALKGHAQTFDHTDVSAPGGAPRHFQTHYLPDIEGAQVRGFYVLIHDVTELTESQHKLAVASHQSQALLETMQMHAIYSVADRKGLIIDVNDAFCRISGYSRDELMGANHRIVNSGLHPKAFWADMWHTISQGQPWRGEICNRAKDGSLYWVDSIIAPFRGPDGRIDRYISLRTDVTERRLTEERLRAASEGFLERAGQMAGVGGWELDLATGEMVLTRQTRAIFGLDQDRRLTLEESLQFFQYPARELLRHAIQDASRLNKGWDLELPFVNAAGDKLWVRTVGGADRVVVLDDGRPGRLVGALQDVTTKHLTEQALLDAKRTAEAASSAKTEFLANMSHEIRTPLNAIMGMTHLLGESLHDAEQRAWVSKIQAANKSLLTVLNDVLDLSKIEAGELTLEASHFSLRKLLKEIESLFAPQAIGKSLSFSIQTPEELPDVVHGDHFRIRQVLLNLLSNAFKFTQQGSVTLGVRVVQQSAHEVELRFGITDTGMGMSADTVARLFEPFTQADASTTRRFGGTGLGLSIVRRLVTLMGGEVGVHSEEGRGSQFWFTLPLALGAADDTAPMGPDHLRVALIGTYSNDMSHLTSLADHMGWVVTCVDMEDDEATLDALDLHGPRRPDLIVLEYALLHSLWWQALVRHGADQPDALGSPILVYRNARHADAPPATTEDGVDGEVLHPWSCASLYNAAQVALARHGQTGDRLYAASKPEAMAVRWLDGVRILVVDDSDINLEVAQRLLRSEGAEVHIARDGQEALQCLQAQQRDFDAVLMDVQMPVMDGKEATRRIRRDMGLTQLPIIALTAGALLTERQRAMDAGMNDFASKPLEPHALIRVIRRHVEQARGQAVALVAQAHALSSQVESLEGGPVTPARWPRIDGIDMQAVAAEFDDDRVFYRGLLRRLLHDHGAPLVNGPAPLRDPAARDALAARLHKLHGTASVLRAVQLAALAKEGEARLRQDPGADLSVHLLAIEQEFERIAQSAHAWLNQKDESIEASHATSDAPEAATSSWRDWVAALGAQDLQALERFQQLRPALRHRLPPAGFAALQEAMESLNFAQALAVLSDYEVMDESVNEVPNEATEKA